MTKQNGSKPTKAAAQTTDEITQALRDRLREIKTESGKIESALKHLTKK